MSYRKTWDLEFLGGVDAFVVDTKALSCRDFWVTNNTGGDLYLQAFNATALPVDGTIPAYSTRVLAGKTAGHSFESGAFFSTGLVLALSSTPNILTVNGTGGGTFGAVVKYEA
jgi:hypothetical protein